MGQVEVLTWLQEQHRRDAMAFFTPKEVIAGLKEQGKLGCPGPVYGHLTALAKVGVLEVKGFDSEHPWRDYQRRYRWTKKAV